MWETWVRSLGREDPLEKEMATHSSILAWKIPWTEDPGRLYSPWGRKESDTTERLHFLSFTIVCPLELNQQMVGKCPVRLPRWPSGKDSPADAGRLVQSPGLIDPLA